MCCWNSHVNLNNSGIRRSKYGSKNLSCSNVSAVCKSPIILSTWSKLPYEYSDVRSCRNTKGRGRRLVFLSLHNPRWWRQRWDTYLSPLVASQSETNVCNEPRVNVTPSCYRSCSMGLLPDTYNCACAGNAGNVFPARWLADPDMHHGTCRDACRDR